MKIKNLLSLSMFCCILFCNCNTTPPQEVNIIPKPVNLEIKEGCFSLTPATVINVVAGSEDLEAANRYFSELLSASLGAPLAITEGTAQKKAINVTVSPQLKPESYELTVDQQAIHITAGSGKGVFYAYQSLRQMLPVEIENGTPLKKINIQNVSIKDEPRFGYRGMMLDVCRHFFPVEDVKTYIDMLALHKLDRFHWHLTDDQGWRIEIKKYPKLMEIGSTRPETVIGRNSGEYDGTPVEGYYTQEQIREIVQYAADRYITIIPEIELPGHASAALASYPYLGCTGGPYEVEKLWGVFDDVFCAGKETTFQFFEEVFDEIIPLFPSEYIHIGGDECPKTRWKNCPDCQKRIRQEKLKNEAELQSYFVHRIENYLNSKGKKIIGWDEILEGGISQTATIMSWRGTQGGIRAAKQGNQVVMTPNNYVYLDYYQSKDTDKEPLAIGGYVPVDTVYSLNPTAGLNEAEAAKVIGVQANLWSEYIPQFSHVQYMTLPRMAALAEVAWTPNSLKDFTDFKRRIPALMKRYEALNYNFARHLLATETQTTAETETK